MTRGDRVSVSAVWPSARWGGDRRDGLDDVGREKAEWEDPADVALIDAMTFGEITDRPNFATPDLSEPMSALRDGCDQMGVGSRRPFPFAGDDELHLHAAPLEPDREIEPVFVFAPCFRVRLFRLWVAMTQHCTQSLCAKN